MITTNIEIAKQHLINEDIIAIPTETVYGLAGNAFNEIAIKKIFALKKRPFYNPLIVHIKSVDYLPIVAKDIPDVAMKLANHFWPGALTLLLKKQSIVPDLVTAGKDTVAVRIPNHALTLQLLSGLNFPLAAPSANPFGSISPTNAEHVHNYFKDDLAVILDGGLCENGVESTIIGFENELPVLYRLGAISIEEIEKVVGTIKLKKHNSGTNVEAPGMLTKHYSPKTTTYLTNNISEEIKKFADKKIGLLLFKDLVNSDIKIENQEILSNSGNMKEIGRAHV